MRRRRIAQHLPASTDLPGFLLAWLLPPLAMILSIVVTAPLRGEALEASQLIDMWPGYLGPTLRWTAGLLIAIRIGFSLAQIESRFLFAATMMVVEIGILITLAGWPQDGMEVAQCAFVTAVAFLTAWIAAPFKPVTPPPS